ncbi:peptide-methionine (S)-S-oxide reductase MsrA [Pedobacter sp. UYP1]|uniref:peptide-methionine (S)-S-oxide reductase MsrA n=1 Tax=Pedobacter sp. UYP1 TaxID=1756396 RepID=UPI00339897D6
MNIHKLWMLGLILLSACVKGQSSNQDQVYATLPVAKPNEQVATFAGGCFWSLSEGLSELKGVDQVIAGYSGGNTKRPSYAQVCADNTGHAESVEVYYDPKVVSYADLVESFLYAHDPTTLNRQGPDQGKDYRSVAFYRTPEEQKIIKEVIAKVNATHHYARPIVTLVVPFKVIYPAEKYHQNYYRLHPDEPYIENVSLPKVMKLRENRAAYLKPEFKRG